MLMHMSRYSLLYQEEVRLRAVTTRLPWPLDTITTTVLPLRARRSVQRFLDDSSPTATGHVVSPNHAATVGAATTGAAVEGWGADPEAGRTIGPSHDS